MTDAKEITIHCSKIGDWLDCSWRQAFQERDKTRVAVSGIVGSQVHKLIAGEAMDDDPASGSVVRYDRHTPSMRDINQQAITIARDIEAFHRTKPDWELLARELKLEAEFEADDLHITLNGTIDAVFKIQDEIVIIDYKTGSMLNDIAFQLAAYIMLWNAHNPSQNAKFGGWVWRPRGKKGEVKSDLVDAAELLTLSPMIIDAAKAMHSPAPNPKSLSCYYCSVEKCTAAIGRRFYEEK